jgi:prepilin-type N-terminal cleavage/methylation domain-containing protein
MRNEKGFSLIELLIVIAVILIIVAIAIPNLIRSRMSANEASAVASLKTINTAQITYSVMYPTIGFADNLSKLGQSANPFDPPTPAKSQILDWLLGCNSPTCERSGYSFSIVPTGAGMITYYEAYAVPQVIGTTGIRGFCTSSLSKMTVDLNGGTACTIDLQ